MCGRYTLFSSPGDISRYFSASLKYDYGKSYNIAPTATVAVLIALENERFILPMRWGLIPSWYKEGQKLTVLNNAKLETVDTKPSFRVPFKRHRCLIIADGFYEWDARTKPKQPYYFHMKHHQPIALAGIWDRWIFENKTVESCCIITEPANKLVSKVHNRMPAIILPKDFDSWLNPDFQDISIIKNMAQVAAAYAHMEVYPVTSKMNRAAFDNIQCIKSIVNTNDIPEI